MGQVTYQEKLTMTPTERNQAMKAMLVAADLTHVEEPDNWIAYRVNPFDFYWDLIKYCSSHSLTKWKYGLVKSNLTWRHSLDKISK
jgi:hypothetical protein